MTRSRALSRRIACFARTLPSTTGLTASRCEGLGVSEMWSEWPSSSTRSAEAPR